MAHHTLVLPVCLLHAGKVLATMRSCDANDVNTAVSNAREAFRSWSQLSGMQRGKLLTKASQIMRVSFLQARVATFSLRYLSHISRSVTHWSYCVYELYYILQNL